MRQHVRVLRDDLLKVHHGTKTEEGFRLNIRVGVQYIEAWLRGRGAVPIYNLMEDAATAEISRAQIWQWIRYEAELEGGTRRHAEVLRARAGRRDGAGARRRSAPTTYANGRFPRSDRAVPRHLARAGVRRVPDDPGLPADRLAWHLNPRSPDTVGRCADFQRTPPDLLLAARLDLAIELLERAFQVALRLQARVALFLQGLQS